MAIIKYSVFFILFWVVPVWGEDEGEIQEVDPSCEKILDVGRPESIALTELETETGSDTGGTPAGAGSH
ncbi:MAG: hypothetical protein OXB84_04095 [Halobacteriovoraceae bacterium]|nr:hypothetical protein [Halobacteriovoraceae bacterium]